MCPARVPHGPTAQSISLGNMSSEDRGIVHACRAALGDPCRPLTAEAWGTHRSQVARCTALRIQPTVQPRPAVVSPEEASGYSRPKLGCMFGARGCSVFDCGTCLLRSFLRDVPHVLELTTTGSGEQGTLGGDSSVGW
jgi:hypothetical protein